MKYAIQVLQNRAGRGVVDIDGTLVPNLVKKIIEDRIKHFESIQPKQHSDESRATVAHIIFELKDLLKKGVA